MSETQRGPVTCTARRSRVVRCLRPRETYRSARQKGTIAILTAVILLVLVGFVSLALDLSRIYNRKVELQNLAETVALAAAQKLDGTAPGIDAAVTAAADAASGFVFAYHLKVNWSQDAISFGNSPRRDGTWDGAASAKGVAAQVFFVRVDTSQLDEEHARVDMIFMPALAASLKQTLINAVAVAGRTAIDVTPLAICAMSASAASNRPNSGGNAELVEYGFRRGVSYDLMRLNPNGTSPANYVINPIAAPGTGGAAGDTSTATVSPYVCAGTMASPRLIGGDVPVSSPFPLGELYKQLNSRFGQYEGNFCNFRGAPPDTNVKEFPFANAWGTTTALGQTAAESTSGSKLQTVADLPPPGGTAAEYGPLWAYAKAVKYAATEPTRGYTAFDTSAWSSLYGGQTAKNYPASMPYKALVSAPLDQYKPGLAGRRVLNVALLACPVTTGANATVRAVGKFFMTMPATSDKITAEFAGAVPLARVAGEVELYP